MYIITYVRSCTVHSFVLAICLYAIDEDGYFGQQQVPLTDEIKEILEEYPDGQIFKVCLFLNIYLAMYVHIMKHVSR